MKNLLMIALSLAFSIQLAAQNPVINNFVDKYQHLENVTHVNLTGDLVNLISKVKDENGDRKFVSTLDAIRVISIDFRFVLIRFLMDRSSSHHQDLPHRRPTMVNLIRV